MNKHNKIYLNLTIALLLVFLFSCVNTKTENKKFATLIINIDEENEHVLSIRLMNIFDKKISLCFNGEIHWKNYVSDPEDTLFYDTILEIKTMDKILRSNNHFKDQIALFNHKFQSIVLKPDSSTVVPLYYSGNLIKDFNLDNIKAEVRAIIKTVSKTNPLIDVCTNNSIENYLDTTICTNYTKLN